MPLSKLSQAASEIAAGNLDVRIEPRGDAEVEALARAFQKMIAELHVRMDRMSAAAFMDNLTGLGNRAAYAAAAEALSGEISRGTADFTCALLDVNYLKRANDEHGHEAGDALLQDVAAICRDVFGEGHTFRIGGDEFAALLPGTMHLPARHWEEKLEQAVGEFNRAQSSAGGSFARPYGAPLSVAWGIVAFDPAVHSSYDGIFTEADSLMYACKKAQKEMGAADPVPPAPSASE